MNRRSPASIIACLLVLATLCGSAAAQSVEDQIKKLETDRAAAVVQADVATLDKETSDDYSLITVNGQMSDKAQMLNGFKSGQSKLTKNDLSDLKVRVYGATAVVTGKSDVQGTLGGKDVTGPVMFTRVYVQKGGHWVSVAFQQTRISN
jgi:ketosteroid isomerase-like protein